MCASLCPLTLDCLAGRLVCYQNEGNVDKTAVVVSGSCGGHAVLRHLSEEWTPT